MVDRIFDVYSLAIQTDNHNESLSFLWCTNKCLVFWINWAHNTCNSVNTFHMYTYYTLYIILRIQIFVFYNFAESFSDLKFIKYYCWCFSEYGFYWYFWLVQTGIFLSAAMGYVIHSSKTLLGMKLYWFSRSFYLSPFLASLKILIITFCILTESSLWVCLLYCWWD